MLYVAAITLYYIFIMTTLFADTSAMQGTLVTVQLATPSTQWQGNFLPREA